MFIRTVQESYLECKSADFKCCALSPMLSAAPIAPLLVLPYLTCTGGLFPLLESAIKHNLYVCMCVVQLHILYLYCRELLLHTYSIPSARTICVVFTLLEQNAPKYFMS